MSLSQYLGSKNLEIPPKKFSKKFLETGHMILVYKFTQLINILKT